MSDEPPPAATGATSARRSSTLVAAGIFLSRIAGFVRQRAIGHFFGTTAIADAFSAAFRIPNLMQNLLGEGVLSASFIPVHSRLIDEGREEEAGRVAGAIAGLLAVVAGAITLLAVVFADPLTSLLAIGFPEAKRDLTVTLVRIITPGVGFLVLSAWCLGVLNSHRRFFLSYVAPVLWNVLQIAVLVGAAIWLLDDPLRPPGPTDPVMETLVEALGFGTLVGGLAQFLVQVPTVRRLEPHLRPSLRRDLPGVRQVVSAMGPVVAGRGVVQLSAYVDLFLASLLATGALSALFYAQQLYMLPISLFGMSVAAAELPELSTIDQGDRTAVLRRIDDGLARIAFYVVVSAILFIVIGDLVVGALFRTGQFDRPDELVVWAILATFSIALVATTSSRLLQSVLYGQDDPRTPARVAAIRVSLSVVVGLVLMFQLDRFQILNGGIDQVESLPAFGPLPAEVRDIDSNVFRLGAVGLAFGSVTGAWLEFRLLRNTLQRRLQGRVLAGGRRRGRLVLPAAAAVVTGLAARGVVGVWPRLIGGPLAAAAVVAAYVLVARRTRVAEAHVVVDTLRRRLGRPG